MTTGLREPGDSDAVAFWRSLVEPEAEPERAWTWYWRMDCGTCPFFMTGLPTRKEANQHGRIHVRQKHANDEEWEFRVRGFQRLSRKE